MCSSLHIQGKQASGRRSPCVEHHICSWDRARPANRGIYWFIRLKSAFKFLEDEIKEVILKRHLSKLQLKWLTSQQDLKQ